MPGGRRGRRSEVDVLGGNLPVLPNNHGPQTDRLVYGLGPFAGYSSGDPTSREDGLYTGRTSWTPSSIACRAADGLSPGSSDDPYQLDEKGIFDLVNLQQ